ncbi:unnamed protein product [Caenorhabditis bovis]|uniref:Protein kinase domain-containing protein n=1 Tax=Caenorhabditis bovis TaxID=2654633 RepID=A0A8S1FDT9_9PELO|nr:unnamed protein product [Caenorhabditis bovis]
MFDLISFSWQLSRALVHLKQCNYTHRDIALRNLLVCNAHIIKLTDFEMARKGETKVGKKIPVMSYAPETFAGFYGFHSEVWSFGITVWEILSFGQHPSITTPKVSIPLIGVIVLVIASALVAVFYLRNPTITDGFFPGDIGEEPSNILTQSGGDHSLFLTTLSTVHVPTTTTSNSVTEAPTTHAFAVYPIADNATPVHPIEPVKHI